MMLEKNLENPTLFQRKQVEKNDKKNQENLSR